MAALSGCLLLSGANCLYSCNHISLASNTWVDKYSLQVLFILHCGSWCGHRDWWKRTPQRYPSKVHLQAYPKVCPPRPTLQQGSTPKGFFPSITACCNQGLQTHKPMGLGISCSNHYRKGGTVEGGQRRKNGTWRSWGCMMVGMRRCAEPVRDQTVGSASPKRPVDKNPQ